MEQDYKKYIGESVVVLIKKPDGSKEPRNGVITRVNLERGLVWVLFERLREESFAYPEDIQTGKITLVDA
jgi:ribosomal protein L35AE/L33A